MKPAHSLAVLLFLSACTKDISNTPGKTNPSVPSVPSVLSSPLQQAPVAKRTDTDDPPLTAQKEVQRKQVFLLDFNGHLLQNTTWNAYLGEPEITLGGSGLTAAQKHAVLQGVKDAFAGYDVTITAAEGLFNVLPAQKIRIVITQDWERFGWIGGSSWQSGFWWGDPTPNLVFTAPLGYREDWIIAATVNAIGHGLGFETRVRDDGTLDTGDGTTAPWMGSALQGQGVWSAGLITGGYWQDEPGALAGWLGQK